MDVKYRHSQGDSILIPDEGWWMQITKQDSFTTQHTMAILSSKLLII
jgi:hypothetical protein